MAKVKILRLTKHFGANVSSEVAGFSPDTAAHIIKNDGGELLGEVEEGQVWKAPADKAEKR